MIIGGKAAAILAPRLPTGSLTAIIGGTLAGGLHAISGPDHIAAVLPRCIGQKWWRASRIGATWAFGHGCSASLVGLLAFFLKGHLSNGLCLQSFASWTEALVGLSLVYIGLLGIRESKNFEQPEMTLSSAYNSEPADRERIGSSRTILLNGVLHGFALDSTPSLALALALPNFGLCLSFLLAYCAGTVASMTMVTTLVGEGSVRMGESIDQPNFTEKLSMVSSIIAVVVGVVWTAKSMAAFRFFKFLR